MPSPAAPGFCPVDFSTWARAPYFDYYYNRIHSRYTLGADVDVGALLAAVHTSGHKFFPAMLYVVMRAVNAHGEFRMAFDSEGKLGTWEHVDAAYTVFHADDESFSDIWSPWSPDFAVFYENVIGDMARYGGIHAVKAKPGTPPHFCPVSNLPWLHFTYLTQDTYAESPFLFPLIRFGKYAPEKGTLLLPLSVSVHHAVADGFHTCRLINEIRALAAEPEAWLAPRSH